MTFPITAPWAEASPDIQRTDLPRPPSPFVGPSLSMGCAQAAQASYERATGKPYDPLETFAEACAALRLSDDVRVAEALLSMIDREDASARGARVNSDFVLVYESDLPKRLPAAVYDFLWPSSKLVDGVRMFPWPIARLGELKHGPSTDPGFSRRRRRPSLRAPMRFAPNELKRAAGDSVCAACGKPYWDHRQIAFTDRPDSNDDSLALIMTILCDGNMVKL